MKIWEKRDDRKGKNVKEKNKMGLFWLSVSFYDSLFTAFTACIAFILFAVSEVFFPHSSQFLSLQSRTVLTVCSSTHQMYLMQNILFHETTESVLSACFLPFHPQKSLWNMHTTWNILTNLRTGKIMVSTSLVPHVPFFTRFKSCLILWNFLLSKETYINCYSAFW